ncbi:class D beta-lactamase [Paramylibacter ulvae]|nr:class D beta-lactamase [Amylibacter ulvae]
MLAPFASGMFLALSASANTLCQIVVDTDTHNTVREIGDCNARYTPASTFKIPLAVMGYDAGFLLDAQTPSIPYRDGYVAWGGANWKTDTTPARWLQYSVVWYSQQIAKSLGQTRIEQYARDFGFGNADLSGDEGKNNGLERGWINSSLQISPREQVQFISKLITYDLPVENSAIDKTLAIVTEFSANHGWQVWGKTGSAYPRKPSGGFDYDRGWGWFVGWAKRDETTIVFAHLTQDEKRPNVSVAKRTRAAMIKAIESLPR